MTHEHPAMEAEEAPIKATTPDPEPAVVAEDVAVTEAAGVVEVEAEVGEPVAVDDAPATVGGDAAATEAVEEALAVVNPQLGVYIGSVA